MEFVNSLANESKLEFQGIASNVSDTILWKSRYEQCLQANVDIYKSRFSLAKTKKKIT